MDTPGLLLLAENLVLSCLLLYFSFDANFQNLCERENFLQYMG